MTTSQPETDSGLSEGDSVYINRVGQFILGPKLGNSPVKSIVIYLARHEGTNEFYTLKILTVKKPSEKPTTDDLQGKVLLHSEFSLLNLLRGHSGVVQHHGLFKDENPDGSARYVLVLDCYTPHDFCPKYSHLINLQHYVIKEKKLPEAEALKIFLNVIKIVQGLHSKNIVHRDLKLGNIILNRKTGDVSIANFCLGKHLCNEADLLRDQRGSPAYIAPDVISGKPYLGKPSDMWALGVVLYTMLYGQFPFYDQSPSELFRKIKLAEFQIPVEHNVCYRTSELIQNLLTLDPKKRWSASRAKHAIQLILEEEQALQCESTPQVVPERSTSMPKSVVSGRVKRTFARMEKDSVNMRKACMSDIESLLSQYTDPKANNNDDERSLVHEPPTKKAKLLHRGCLATKITRVKEDARAFTNGDLGRLHAICKAKEVASDSQQANNSVANANMVSSSSSSTSTASTSTGGGTIAPPAAAAPTPVLTKMIPPNVRTSATAPAGAHVVTGGSPVVMNSSRLINPVSSLGQQSVLPR